MFGGAVLSGQDWQAVLLTLKLAAVTTVLLLLLGTPLAWYLARMNSRAKIWLEAVISLPLVLPPTVLGFYLLIAMSPRYLPGQWWMQLSGSSLAFSFTGLVIGSVLYSLPFVVQPIQQAFERFDNKLLQAAATLGAGPGRRFTHVILPLLKRTFITAASLGFAHTLGEFGVVLMIGGNIPGETQVLSIALFDHVEATDYGQAHVLAGGMLLFSLLLLVFINRINHQGRWLGA